MTTLQYESFKRTSLALQTLTRVPDCYTTQKYKRPLLAYDFLSLWKEERKHEKTQMLLIASWAQFQNKTGFSHSIVVHKGDTSARSNLCLNEMNQLEYNR